MALPKAEIQRRDAERKRLRYATDPEFKARRTATNKRWRQANREKSSRQGAAASARWRERNPERYAEQQLMRTYGISLTEWQQMRASQNGACAICACTNKPLVVDHDHNTGKVRGLLCHKCNVGLGLLGDSQDGLVAALNYMRGF